MVQKILETIDFPYFPLKGLKLDRARQKSTKLSTGDILRHRWTQNFTLNLTVKKELKSDV